MPTVTIELDEYLYNDLKYLANMFNKKIEDIIKFILSANVPAILAVVKYIEKNYMRVGAKEVEPEVPRPSAEKSLELKILEYIEEKGGRVYFPELITHFDPEVVKKLIESGKVIYKDGYICTRQPCPS